MFGLLECTLLSSPQQVFRNQRGTLMLFSNSTLALYLQEELNAEDVDFAEELANDLAEVLEITDCEVSFLCML
jgi:hypothetical protein